jgi:hypothetical protein
VKKSLHEELKQWCKEPGDLLEEMVVGFHIDIVRGKLLIEIQTTNFSSLKSKLSTLTKKHPVRLVYPIAQENWIVRLAADGMTQIGGRKSPKRGNPFHLFQELVSIRELIKGGNFLWKSCLSGKRRSSVTMAGVAGDAKDGAFPIAAFLKL